MPARKSRSFFPGGGGAHPDTANGNPNKYAWTLSQMDFNPANIAAWDPTVDIQTRPLWPYIKNAAVYKCPADHSHITVNGVSHPRVRTISMNCYLGGFLGTDGGWSQDDIFMIYHKMADVGGGSSPGAAKLSVFLDEREDCVNWGNYMTDMTGWTANQKPSPAYEYSGDMPGIYHNLSAGFSFADGHSEQRRWRDGATLTPMHYQDALWLSSTGWPKRDPFGPDVWWLQDKSPRPK